MYVPLDRAEWFIFDAPIIVASQITTRVMMDSVAEYWVCTEYVFISQHQGQSSELYLPSQ